MASFTHCEVAEKRHDIGRNVDQQNAAQPDVVVHEADDGACEEPSTLHTGHQKSIGMHEPVFRREFLNERGDRRPEHPEAGSDQCVHQIEFPDLHAMQEREDSDRHDNHGAQRIEPHHQAPAVFPVDNYAGERQHEHGGNGLQNHQHSQRLFGVRGLQNVPGHGG